MQGSFNLYVWINITFEKHCSHCQNCENYKYALVLYVCLMKVFILLVQILTWSETLSAALVELLLL